MLQRDAVVDGRYQVVGTLGSGAAGTVYLVEVVNQPGRTLALKEMQAADAEPDQKRRFEREASAWMAARHRSLATVHDFFLGQDTAYLLMDYLPGRTLWDTLLALPRAPAWEQVSAWLRVFTDALRFLHGRQPAMVLRELEPSNCIVQPDGELKLVSFGLARIFTAPEPNPFSAPEEHGDAGEDPRADIYSLGATLYVLMSRHLPPESWERGAGLARLPPAPEVPPLIMKVIDKMMAVDPQERFQTVAEAVAALQIAAAPTAVTEVPAARLPLQPKFVPPAARPASAAAAAPVEEEEEVDEVVTLTEYLREVVAEYEKKVNGIGKNGLTAPMLLYYRDEVQDTLDSLVELGVDAKVWWEYVVDLDAVVKERVKDVVDEIGWANFKQYWIMNDPPQERWWWFLSKMVSAPPPPPRFWEVWKKEKKP